MDIYSQPDKSGKQKLIKRNCIYLKQFETHEIKIEQYVNSKGIVSNKWSNVREGENFFRVAHSFEELEKMMSPIEFKGFKYKGNGREK